MEKSPSDYNDSIDNQNNSDESFDLLRNENNNKNPNEFYLDNCETGITNLIKDDKINNNKVSENNLLGRKKKEPNKFSLDNNEEKEKKTHTKYDFDNIFKKIKPILLDKLHIFINSVIETKYNGNIGHDIFLKQLLKIDKKQFFSMKNKELLYKTLQQIFSIPIRNNISKYNNEHNKLLITKLLNEEDKEKRDFFNKLFNITFIDCIKHFRGTDIIEELNGLYSMKDFLNQFNNDKDYQNTAKYYISNIEDIIVGRKKA